MKCIINDDVVLSRPLEGPLSAHIAAFAQWAVELWPGESENGAFRQPGSSNSSNRLLTAGRGVRIRLLAPSWLQASAGVSPGPGRIPSQLTSHVHRVVSLLKRWLLGTHHGAVFVRPLHGMRCGATTLINSRDVITLVFFQNFGKWPWLPVTR
jgi:hypothetical protein